MDQSVDFNELQGRCIKYLDERKFISVATATNNEVRARVVDYANKGIEIAFITWENTLKMKHLKKNPRVSLCVDALQIEGSVRILGHPALEENAPYMEIYEKRLPSPFKNFISMGNSILIVIDPTLLILMKYESNHLYLDHLDVSKKMAFRKELSRWNP